MGSTERVARLSRLCFLVLTAVALAWILALFVTGGFVLEFGGLRISSRNAKRFFLLYAAVLLLYTWRAGGAAATEALATFSRWWTARGTALVLAAATVGCGVVFNSYAATGADTYGYVSQAELWRKGDLRVPMPLAASLPWGDATWSLSPLGYRPATVPHHIVPTYAPGLPLMMAVASFAGSSAVYWVVPLLAGWLVWVTFSLGRVVGDDTVALLSALLMATSPIFVHHMVAPMSDVPAAALWATAMLLSMRNTRSHWAFAGLVASAATLVRPNTVVLAAAPMLGLAWSWLHQPQLRRQLVVQLVLFIAALVPGAVAVAVVNNYLYGSPLLSGYGPAKHLYSWDFLPLNVQRYPSWLVFSETPLIAASVAGAIVLWRQAALRGHLSTFLAVIVLTALCYVFYLPFDTWHFLRFLLPAIPFLLVLTALGAVRLLKFLPPHLRLPIAVAVIGAACVWRMDLARAGFSFRHAEARYAEAGRYVAEKFPENAVFLTMQHSGSLRYYSGRLTLRWDAIDPAWFDRAPEVLRQQGLDPYILVEPEEEAQLRERLGATSRLARIDWPPIAQLSGQRIKIYDPDDAPKGPVR